MATSTRQNRIRYSVKTDADKSGNVHVPSPCVRNCCLDEDDICMGCGRHIEEILSWHQADGEEREDIIVLAKQRLELRKKRQRVQNP